MITFRAIRYVLQRKSETISVGLLALSVGIRSNGMFLAPVIGLEVLYSFFKNLATNFS
jgi:Gpi18-like mannosyltransferase